MPPMTSFFSQTNAPQWKVKIIAYDEKTTKVHPVSFRYIADTHTASVHERGRFDQKNPMSIDAGFYDLVKSCSFSEPLVPSMRQIIQDHEAQVMSRPSVLISRIP